MRVTPLQAETGGFVGDFFVEFGIPPALASAIGFAMQDVIKNYDTYGTLRLRFTFRIGFRDDIDRATDIIREEARATEGILADPEPSVKLIEINDASFGLQSRVWISDPGGSDFVGIRGRFVQAVSERFEREGITIPYPHRTIDGAIEVPDDGDVVGGGQSASQSGD